MQAAEQNERRRTMGEYYRTAHVARVLRTTQQRVRRLARAGLCQPQRDGRFFLFSFEDLVRLRTAEGLLRDGVPLRRVRQALTELPEMSARPAGMRLFTEGSDVLVRHGRHAWKADDGQGVFLFDVDELEADARKILSVTDARAARAAVKARAASAPIHFERALRLEQQGEVEQACAAYETAIELDPALADAYINLGRLLHQGGESAAAATLYQQAITFAPDDPVPHYNLALALEDEDHAQTALAHYQRAVELAEDFADAHFNLGRLLERMGRPREAMRHLMTYKRLTSR